MQAMYLIRDYLTSVPAETSIFSYDAALPVWSRPTRELYQADRSLLMN